MNIDKNKLIPELCTVVNEEWSADLNLNPSMIDHQLCASSFCVAQ